MRARQESEDGVLAELRAGVPTLPDLDGLLVEPDDVGQVVEVVTPVRVVGQPKGGETRQRILKRVPVWVADEYRRLKALLPVSKDTTIDGLMVEALTEYLPEAYRRRGLPYTRKMKQ